MVAISEKDRDVLRFLWVDNIAKEESEVVALRFTRVVFGVTSSPFLLNATIRHHLEGNSIGRHVEASEFLLRGRYCDRSQG